MRKVKFTFNVILMVLFTRPQNWEWEYRELKEKLNQDK